MRNQRDGLKQPHVIPLRKCQLGTELMEYYPMTFVTALLNY